MNGFNRLTQDPDEIGRMWYVPPHPKLRRGWLLYSEDFVLRTFQRLHQSSARPSRSTGWRMAAAVTLAIMAVFQLLIVILSRMPIVSWLMYMLARGFPRNAVGFFLRGCYWKSRLRRLGVDTLIDQDVEIRRPHRIEVGSHCHVDHHVLLSVGDENGHITLGDYVHIGPGGIVAGRGGVDIGDFAGLAAGVRVYSVSNNPFNPERLGELTSLSHMAPVDRQHTTVAAVNIGDYAVIGPASLILPGVTLGRGVIVHAYADVRESFPDFAIVSGYGRSRRQGWRRPAKLDPRLAASGDSAPE